GITTNPTIIAKENRNFEETIKEICRIVDGPVSAEVIGLTVDEMVEEARNIATWAPNVVVKIPMTEAGLEAVNILSKERSEEHTSELQSRFDLVCRLL